MNHDLTIEPPDYSGSVMKRARGVWLADFTNHDTGDQEYDAFPTEAQARRWVRDHMEPARVRWTQKDGWTYAEAWAVPE